MRDPMSEPNEQDYADQATRRMTAKREWVEWRLVYANGKISSLAYFGDVILDEPNIGCNNRAVKIRWEPDKFPERPAMEFRLFYQGPLYSSNGDPRGDQKDRRADHKHDIRRQFHAQLKHLWSIHPVLSRDNIRGGIFGEKYRDKSLLYASGEEHNRLGIKWIPLVCKEFHLLCKLEITFLRRDRPGGILHSRDIDNRLKTLFDAMRIPETLGQLGSYVPSEGDGPFFVLLQNDNLITHVSVETDDLLDPPTGDEVDDGYVRALIHVTLHPYVGTIFNLAFG